MMHIISMASRQVARPVAADGKTIAPAAIVCLALMLALFFLICRIAVVCW